MPPANTVVRTPLYAEFKDPDVKGAKASRLRRVRVGTFWKNGGCHS